MEESKLTVRISRELIENAKRYAAQNHTTLTKLIEAYLQRIPISYLFEDAPITRRLSGLLPTEINAQDYKAHIEEKYGR